MRFGQVRSALATSIGQQTGLTAHATAPSDMTPPCVLIGGHTGQRLTMDGLLAVEVAVFMLVGIDQTDFQDQLDEFVMGDRNVFDALGHRLGIEADVDADGWDEYGQVEWAGVPYWSVRVPTTVTFRR